MLNIRELNEGDRVSLRCPQARCGEVREAIFVRMVEEADLKRICAAQAVLSATSRWNTWTEAAVFQIAAQLIPVTESGDTMLEAKLVAMFGVVGEHMEDDEGRAIWIEQKLTMGRG